VNVKYEGKILLYPNPTAGTVTIKGLKDESYRITIYSSTDRRIATIPVMPSDKLEQALNNVLPVLTRGFYTLVIQSNTDVKISRLVLK
jgi:hypothetical protein